MLIIVITYLIFFFIAGVIYSYVTPILNNPDHTSLDILSMALFWPISVWILLIELRDQITILQKTQK